MPRCLLTFREHKRLSLQLFLTAYVNCTSGHLYTTRFNTHKFYIPPTECIYVFIQQYLISFCKRDGQYMYNEQTNPHVIDSLSYCFFIYRSYTFERQRIVRKLSLGGHQDRMNTFV